MIDYALSQCVIRVITCLFPTNMLEKPFNQFKKYEKKNFALLMKPLVTSKRNETKSH